MMAQKDERSLIGASVGTLYLVPTPLDHGCESQVPLEQVLPLRTIQVAASITHWITENARSTRAFLQRVDAVVPLQQPLRAQQMTELPRAIHKQGDHLNCKWDPRPLLAPLRSGHAMGLVSEAGMPAIADPGSSVVRSAHLLGIPVTPLVGPVSVMLALAASGLNGQNFAFVGYLPREVEARKQRIRELEARARASGQAQLMIEAPYRNHALLLALITTLHTDTWLAVASGLTLDASRVRADRVAAWREQPAIALDRLPAIFALGV